MSSPIFRWVVSDPVKLAGLLETQGLSAALAEGRVFVDGKRAATAAPLAAGALVEVFPPRPRAEITLLAELGEVLAVSKPAALPTEPDHSGGECVLSQLARKLDLELRNLHAISRLDVGVSGVLLVTLGAAARERLLLERAEGRLERRYVALGCGVPDPTAGEWRDALGKVQAGKRGVSGRDARPAHTRYRVVAHANAVTAEAPVTSLLALTPVTGRTHQLRAHAALHGAALLGDRKYGGPARLTAKDGSVHAFSQILLHAAWVEVAVLGKRQRIAAEPAAALTEAWQALGGELSALNSALD